MVFFSGWASPAPGPSIHHRGGRQVQVLAGGLAEFRKQKKKRGRFGKKHSNLTNMIYMTWTNHPKIEIVDKV